VEDVSFRMDEHDFAFDVIWLDIEHTDGKRYFTWDKNEFKNPLGMQEKLALQGRCFYFYLFILKYYRKLVTIVDPHVKVDKNYFVYDEATKLDNIVSEGGKEMKRNKVDEGAKILSLKSGLLKNRFEGNKRITDLLERSLEEEFLRVTDLSSGLNTFLKPFENMSSFLGKYEYFNDANEGQKGMLMKNRSGDVFQGGCWPGKSVYPDFLSPLVRLWWASYYTVEKYNG
jgi:alpha-glucosidase (family GH31 glycosyl hydrolase)